MRSSRPNKRPLRQSAARLVAVAFLATLALAPVAVEAQNDDLATILSKQKNVSTYTSLLSKYSDVFAKLPSSGATVLVPTDAAFVKFPDWDQGDAVYGANLLSYHILQGKVSLGAAMPIGASFFAHTGLSVAKYTNVTNGAVTMIAKQPGKEGESDVVVFTSGMASRSTLVGTPDIAWKGGSLQLIDSILTMPARLELTARQAYTDLSSFLGATYAAGVTAQFAETPNITIFAPRNQAMQLVSPALQGMSAEQLARVLRFHMVPDRVIHSSELLHDANFSSALQSLGSLPQSGNGSSSPQLHVTRFNNDIFLNSARIIQTDILIANGVVHMLEDVLNPDAGSLRPDTALGTQAPAFTATTAVVTGAGASIPFTTALPCTANCPVTGGGANATGAGGVKSSSSEGAAAGGVFPAMATGMAGVGAGLALGLAGMEVMGGGLL